jgi:hypothetical protein
MDYLSLLMLARHALDVDGGYGNFDKGGVTDILRVFASLV